MSKRNLLQREQAITTAHSCQGCGGPQPTIARSPATVGTSEHDMVDTLLFLHHPLLSHSRKLSHKVILSHKFTLLSHKLPLSCEALLGVTDSVPPASSYKLKKRLKSLMPRPRSRYIYNATIPGNRLVQTMIYACIPLTCPQA